MNSGRPAFPGLRRLLSPRLLLVLLLLAGGSAFVLLPGLQRMLGLAQRYAWFLDSYAILAASDAKHAGLDPFQPNPLDVFQRPHSYSDWWFLLGRLGLAREHNFWVGGGMVLVFFAAAVAILRPRSWGEAIWQAALVLSPPVLLAVNRANNDLVIFAVLGAGLLAAGPARSWRPAGFVAAAVVATGLKFFPVVAGAALFVLRPARRGLAWAAGAVLLSLVVLAGVRASLARAVIPVPTGTGLFGAAIFWRDVGWSGPASTAATVLILAAGAAALARRGGLAGLATDAPDERERLAFAVGALLLLACFVAGISFGYRWVFALWLAPWLWRRPFFGRALLTAVVWMDGLFCFLVNTLVGPMELARLQRWETGWGRCSQPLVWLLMAVLAGSLLEAALAQWAELRRRPPAA